MKTLTRTVLNATFTLSILLLPTCYAASYKEIFQQFQAQNEGYAEYKIQTIKHMSNNAIHSSVAASGDVDGDGLDEVIFEIHKNNDKRIVVMKGLENGQFQTLLINQAMTRADIFLTLKINTGRSSFIVSSHSAGILGIIDENEQDSKKTVEFGLSGTNLPIKKLTYGPFWLTSNDSLSPSPSYTYNFDKSCYTRAWSTVEKNTKSKLDTLEGKTERGKLSLKNNNTIYMNNDTDPFSTNDPLGVVPAVLAGEINTTPNEQSDNSWSCY